MMNCYYRGLLLLHCVAALINVPINLLVLWVSHLKPAFQVCFTAGLSEVHQNQP